MWRTRPRACSLPAKESPKASWRSSTTLNVYRDTVELILNAPYGSVRLFDIDRVLKVCRALLPGLEKTEEEEA